MDQSSKASLGANLDPYETAPQELKDLYKSWTGVVSTARLPDTSKMAPLIAPDSTNMTNTDMASVFTEFVLRNLYRQCPTIDNLPEDSAMMIMPGEGSRETQRSNPLGAIRRILPTQTDTCLSKVAEDRKFIDKREPILKFLEDRPVGASSLKGMPGLTILPQLLPPIVQQVLLDCLLHRELAIPENKTNIHLHYNVSYPEGKASFFSTEPESHSFSPKDPGEHKRFTNRVALEKSLRWVTLGGQYDWTKKAYPSEAPPQFPEDIARLIGALFSDMEPQAAIVNIYSAKDKLSLHRDVSEEADRGLVSISLGCSCIFMIGLKDKETEEIHHQALRLDSGDVLYMSGESRYAWHGVPKILPETCPEYLEDWPGKEYPGWDGWMSRKRINLNIRQMYEPIGAGHH